MRISEIIWKISISYIFSYFWISHFFLNSAFFQPTIFIPISDAIFGTENMIEDFFYHFLHQRCTFFRINHILPCFLVGTVSGRSNGNCHIFGLQKRIINHTETIRVFFSRTIITVVFPYPIPDIFFFDRSAFYRQSHSDHRLNLFSLPAQSKTNIRGLPDTDIYTRIRLVHIGTHSKNTFQNYQKYTLTVFKDTLWEKVLGY